jgi:ribosomal protein S1
MSIGDAGKIRLSLRGKDVGGGPQEAQFAALKTGQISVGTVQRVTDFGVFVTLDGTSLVGLSRRVNALSKGSTDLSEAYKPGDVVRVKILTVSQTTKKIGLGE